MTKLKKRFAITSDAVGRLIKIRDGVVYQNFLNFIEELIQNCQRAKATVVNITVDHKTLVVEDNGVGCDDPATVLTLDVSGFGIGFGEGFGSIYTVADEFEIKSSNWIATLDVNSAIRKRDLTVDVYDLDEAVRGFTVKINGEKIANNNSLITDKAYEVCQYIPNIRFTLNGNTIPKRDIMELDESYQYHERFDNRMYTAHLSLTKNGEYGYIKVFHDHRFVREYGYVGASGAIHLKSNAVTLRSPDRKDIIHDRKWDRFKKMIHKDICYLLKQVLTDGNSEAITNYSDTIENYLDVESYIKYLTIRDNEVANQFETRKKNEPVNNDNELEEDESIPLDISSIGQHIGKSFGTFAETNAFNHESDTTVGNDMTPVLNSASLATVTNNEVAATTQKSTPMNQENVDTRRSEQDQIFTSFVTGHKQHIFVRNIKEVSIKNIRNKKNVVWVEKEDQDKYEDLVSKYEYYGIFTFISPHILYHKSLRFLDIPHISTVENMAIEKQYEVTRIGAISKKEERVMEILSFIENNLGLGKTFYISDIKCKKIVNLRGSKLFQEKMNVEGYQKGNEIHLNRKSLIFGKMNCILLGRTSISVHDLKFILNNLELISHELAHLMYGTQDNTKEHYEKENLVQKQISQIISNCENLY